MTDPKRDRCMPQFVEIDIERVEWDEDYRTALKQVLAVEAVLQSRRTTGGGADPVATSRRRPARRSK